MVLADFGFARKGPINEKLNEYVGSPQYAAPELISAIPYSGVKSDVWAIGVCLYVLFTGEYPFYSENKGKLTEQILKNPVFHDPGESYYDKVSENCRELIKMMLTKNPDDRPTLEGLQNHPCLSGEPSGDLDFPRGTSFNPEKIEDTGEYILVKGVGEKRQWTPKLVRRRRASDLA